MAEKKFSQNGADVNALDFGDSAVLPFSVEAEQSVLGSIIIDPKCYLRAATLLKNDYFYLPQHREIYAALTEMFEKNQPVDIVTLLEKLKGRGVYDDAGGKAYLTQIIQTVPSTANVENYIAIVRDKYFARSLLAAAKGIIKDINENTLDSNLLLDRAEQQIYDIRQGRENTDLVTHKIGYY